MFTINRTSRKSATAYSSRKVYLPLTAICCFSFFISTDSIAQENSIAYVPTKEAATYENPFKNGADGYKEVLYEEGMDAKLEEKTNLILEDIFFAYNDDKILPQSERVLDDLVRILRANQDLAIELSADTDSRGTAYYNGRLSRKRASNMVKYLTRKGISAARLLPVGSGEDSPRNHCIDGVTCTEYEHRENRRIEMRTARIITVLPLRNYIYKN